MRAENFNLDEIFARLTKSKFRSGFKLKPADIEYINKKGLATIEQHARDFVIKRLAPAKPKNDGRQTPTKGHPVFIAQPARLHLIVFLKKLEI
jgi:hypothetical protein